METKFVSEEFENLKFQFEISKKSRGGRQYLPYVFREQGVATLSGILKNKRLIERKLEKEVID